MPDTLTITDNRTGKQYEIPIQDGTIRAMDLRQIKVHADEFGMMTYDPAFMNTAACRSRITFIDGDKGVLLYRGYPIEQLAEHSDFLETAYLILFGELPTNSQHEQWTRDITLHTMLHENVKTFMQGFQYDAHPMGISYCLPVRLSVIVSVSAMRSRRSVSRRCRGCRAQRPRLGLGPRPPARRRAPDSPPRAIDRGPPSGTARCRRAGAPDRSAGDGSTRRGVRTAPNPVIVSNGECNR